MTHDTHKYRDFLSIVLHEERLYGISLEQGELYPLYVYGPLQDTLDAGHPPPLLHEWPEYAKDFVAQYVPLPVILTNLGTLISEQLPNFPLVDDFLKQIPEVLLPRSIRNDISSQNRQGGTYSWEQTTFRLWPLYYVGPGMFVDENSDHPAMFRPATLSLTWLAQPDSQNGLERQNDGGYTFPPPGLGP